MKEAHFSLLLWDYCIDTISKINNLTVNIQFNLHVTNAHTLLTGDQG